MEVYTADKTENKKAKRKIFCMTSKEKLLTLEIKIFQTWIKKEENYYYKRKKLLNHSINRVEELENSSVNK